MMRKIKAFLILSFLTFSAFAHKAQKQTETIIPENLTQKWIECEGAEEGDYQKCFETFYDEVKKAAPSDAVAYYFPEARVIYENILDGIRDGDKEKIAGNVRSWEILQKSLAGFQLEQVYYSYRILIFVIIFALLMLLAFFILYLLISKSRKENLVFTAQMIKTQEAERERISNELHDTVCQDLRVLQFLLEDEEAVSLCKKIASDVRNTCYDLIPSDLNEGLFEALISLCDLLKKQSGIEIILFIQDEVKNNRNFKSFSKDKNLNIYRIVQEIITNSIKHSASESISVLVRSLDEKSFKIIVSDEGRGFDLKKAFKKKKHFGLKNIQIRAQNLGGQVYFKTAQGEGTQVTVTLPYQGSAD